MAQSGFTPISLYFSATGAAVPTAGNLVAGELALNTNDGKLYFKNSSGVVTLLAGSTSGPAGGSTTQVQYNNAGVLAGITGATSNGTALTLVAPNLGSPASVGTMPAFTLGGTVSGGGNQINNVVIGTTTPLAGAFTTLSATGATTLSAALTYGGITLTNAVTGTGKMVLDTSPTLVTPALGTPSALVGTNITGTAAGLTAGNVTTNANLTGAITSTGNATSLGSFTSLQLLTALTDETGTGANVFATSPTLVTPALGTPSSGTVTNLTGTASININGTVGATTATTGAFTSVTASTTLGVTGVSTFAAGTAALPAITTTGDTNTGIFFPAADTVGVTTGGTERLRVISTGEVGIGATPTTASKALIVNTSAGASTIALSLQNASDTIASETILDFVTNTSGTGVRSAQITAINTNGSTGVNMLFKIGNGAPAAEAMRITSVGGLQLTRGVGVSNTTPGASGVAFPATAVAVSDANTLDDYEEGSWTPVVTFTGGNGDLTTAVATGVYTKIGRMVQIAFAVEFTETTALTNLTITGVPFTSGGSVASIAVGCWVDNMTALVGSPVILLAASATTIGLQTTGTGAAALITNVNTGASSRVLGSLSYSI